MTTKLFCTLFEWRYRIHTRWINLKFGSFAISWENTSSRQESSWWDHWINTHRFLNRISAVQHHLCFSDFVCSALSLWGIPYRDFSAFFFSYYKTINNPSSTFHFATVINSPDLTDDNKRVSRSNPAFASLRFWWRQQHRPVRRARLPMRSWRAEEAAIFEIWQLNERMMFEYTNHASHVWLNCA